jgi:lysine 2,3-aminomutase
MLHRKTLKFADFSDIPEDHWSDWQWQFRHRITSVNQLKQCLPLSSEEEKAIQQCLRTFSMALTPYYLSLIDKDDPDDVIRKQVVPTSTELCQAPEEMVDPLGEEGHTPVPGLIHRYPDRALLLVTTRCATYCRYCTRKRLVGQKERIGHPAHLEKAIQYISENPSIRDVLLSGGDPLIFSDGKLEGVLKRIRSIRHVDVIRIGTKVPVVLPQRVTPELVRMLRKYHPLWINTHFNHPRELTPESNRACEMMADAGIPLGNQTVLLAGVNDCVHVIRELVHGLVKIRVRPYYLFQCDLSVGTSHFRTPLSKGMEIVEGLRGHTSGFCVPVFAVDIPGGGGKIPLAPNYLISSGYQKTILRNFEGVLSCYSEPDQYTQKCSCPVCTSEKRSVLSGVASLSHQKISLNTGNRDQ